MIGNGQAREKLLLSLTRPSTGGLQTLSKCKLFLVLEVNCFESSQLQSLSHSWAEIINERGRRKVKNKCRFEKDTHLCVHKRTVLQVWPSPPTKETALDIKGTEGEGSFLHWEGTEDLWCHRNKYECYLPTMINLIFSVYSNVSNWG